ncbi:flagellar hook-basal body protein [Metasolibacillus meyeri]|uniref:Flagellar hook-basal body protein n=1 Tax=Metasolibacillus meyeri TaxID=1071052 RepID=A0AAW9NSB4_9BACL|nr:flagellar hook-basal body protein [Metasolibacillus meyeri]MEC1177721.1 flagellar hook-basal body protein [Metasolibacillus meyeri]
MFKGFYTVASGMLAQQRRTEILTNNMANANTPGFKADQSTIRSFPDMLLSAKGTTNVPTEKGLGLKQLNPIGALTTGVYLQETIANNAQGSLLQTDMPTDVALVDITLPIDEASGNQGAIYFRLEHPAGGEAYTRNGNFTLDGQGSLVNGQGLYVLSDTGDRIQLANDNITITNTGAILDENGVQVAVLGVAFSENPDVLMKQDNGLYRMLDDGILPSAYGQAGVTFATNQQYLEASNVDSARSMTELLTAYRAFEANQKVLQAYDRSMEKAVNEIGKV